MSEESNKKTKKRLIPDIITPNKITFARILMIPVFVIFFFVTSIPGNYYWAAGIFAVAGLTDFADGYIARKYKLVSNMGKFLDPIADKVLVSTAFILLLTKYDLFALIFGESGTQAGMIIISVCISVIIARELIISGFRQVAASAGLVLAAEKIGKYKAACQDFAVFFILLSIDLIEEGTIGLIILRAGFFILIIATVLTIISGVSYIVKNREVLKH